MTIDDWLKVVGMAVTVLIAAGSLVWTLSTVYSQLKSIAANVLVLNVKLDVLQSTLNKHDTHLQILDRDVKSLDRDVKEIEKHHRHD